MQAGVLTAMEDASRYGGTAYNIETVIHEEERRLLAKRELEHEAALRPGPT